MKIVKYIIMVKVTLIILIILMILPFPGDAIQHKIEEV